MPEELGREEKRKERKEQKRREKLALLQAEAGVDSASVEQAKTPKQDKDVASEKKKKEKRKVVVEDNAIAVDVSPLTGHPIQRAIN